MQNRNQMKKSKEETANQERIKIERRLGCFVDANGLLNGEWGGFQELCDKGPKGEAMFELYYNRFSRHISINEFGFFYNKFSCKKYDGVLKLDDDVYLCEKNERFGLIDENEKTILHVCYNHINYVDRIKKLFIVSTETGKFLFASKKESYTVTKNVDFHYVQE